MSDARPTNRLAGETSPYLLQHAHNPVDWYPWGPEALARAKAEDKPILLSVGYAACHWCHVMERESFESAETAAVMNAHFVCIKVDREERPDVDQIYQTAVQVLGAHGGWPLTMFLTPELAPFFGGTYYPDKPRYGMPAFVQVLAGVADAWQKRRPQVASSAEQLVQVLQEIDEGEGAGPLEAFERATVATASESLLSRWDEEHPGFGRKPKFPNSLLLELWLRHGAADGGPAWIARAKATFLAMANGGIYDQLGGGFHRYSTDERWLVPHFEKMLYDNALLLRLGAQIQRASPDERIGRVLRETADWAIREMLDSPGGFHSTQDADSEGEEGRFFVWDREEITAVVGERVSGLICRLFGVEEGGNFEHGKTVLHRRMTLTDAARAEGWDLAEAEKAVDEARRKLFEAREKRVHPAKDDKVLAGWNGLLMQGLATTAAVTSESVLLEAAQRCSDFVATTLDRGGELLRTYRAGQAKIPAFSEDYAFLAEGELALFEASGEARHFVRAQSYVDRALEKFADPEGGFFLTAAEGEPLLQRPRSGYDNAVPSATSAMTHALLRLAALTGDARYQDAAEKTLARLHGAMAKNPFGYGWLLCALEAATAGIATLVVTGKPGDLSREALLFAARRTYAPNVVVVPWSGNVPLPAGLASLVEGKGGEAGAYLCRAGTCRPPVRDAEALVRLLRESR